MSRESPVFFGFWVPLSSLYVLFSAADYIDCLMTWVESQLDDEDIFPINTSNFPKNFEKVVKVSQQLCRFVSNAGIMILLSDDISADV